MRTYRRRSTKLMEIFPDPGQKKGRRRGISMPLLTLNKEVWSKSSIFKTKEKEEERKQVTFIMMV